MGTRITDLATATSWAYDDVLEFVDVSDTGMASTGTNKQITLGDAFRVQKPTNASGTLNMDFDPTPGDGTSNANVRVFRNITTTGLRQQLWYRGDGSSIFDHRLISRATANTSSADLCRNGGDVAIGEVPNTVGSRIEIFQSTDNSQSADIVFAKGRGGATLAAIQASDDLGFITWTGYNGSSYTTYAQLMAEPFDVTAASEDVRIRLYGIYQGTVREKLRIEGDGMVFQGEVNPAFGVQEGTGISMAGDRLYMQHTSATAGNITLDSETAGGNGNLDINMVGGTNDDQNIRFHRATDTGTGTADVQFMRGDNTGTTDHFIRGGNSGGLVEFCRNGGNVLINSVPSSRSATVIHQQTSNDTNDPEYHFQKSRGNGTESIVVAGDELGTIRFKGYDGTGYQDNVVLQAENVVATAGSEDGRFKVFIVGSGTVTERFTVEKNFIKIPTVTDGNRASASTAGAGAVFFNTTDGQLNISDGTNWTLPDGTTT